MKILMTNRDHTWWSGGDSNKISRYGEQLRKIGVEVDYSPSIMYPDYNDYDIIHTFHLGHEFSHKFFLEASRLNIPLVLSPIYFPGMGNPQVYQHDMVQYASAIAFLSEGEQAEVCKLYDDIEKINDIEEKSYIIPNGINPAFGEDGPKMLHFNYPDKDYVLCVGRIDSRKNQHKLAQACYELDIPLVLIGSPDEPAVVEAVQAIADSWLGLWWEPAAPPDRLAEAYRGAKVLACPSTLEMWPNVVAEGGLAGCNLVVGNGSMTWTDYDETWTCDDNIDSIKQAVSEAFEAPRRNVKEPFDEFTWERAAQDLKTMYEEVLDAKDQRDSEKAESSYQQNISREGEGSSAVEDVA